MRLLAKNTSLILIFLTFIAYFQVKDFLYLTVDDQTNIEQNHRLQPPGIETLRYYWIPPIGENSQNYQDIYIPLTFTVWAGLAYLSDLFFPDTSYVVLSPAIFHLGNLCVHMLTVLVVQKIIFLLLPKFPDTSLLETNKKLLAFLGATIYSLHPLQVEAVSWVSGMKDLLCAFFGYISVLFWIKHLNAPQKEADRQKGRLSFACYVISMFAFLLACLSKPQALNVCAMIFVISAGIYRARLSLLLLRLTPWFVVSGLTGLLAKNLQPDSLIHTLTPLWTRPLIALDAFSFYIFKTFYPLNLSFDYSRTPLRVLESGQIYHTWLLPVLLTLAAAFSKQRQIWLKLISLFFAGFASVSGIVPFYSQNISTTSDRYMLFPMLAVSLAMPIVAAKLFKKFWTQRYVITFLLVIMLSVMFYITYNQISTWRDEKTF